MATQHEGGGSVTRWIGELKAGDPDAARPLWDRYFERLARLASKKLGSAPRAAADEEDAALSAFDSLCRGAAQGRFPLLTDRDDLWRLLVVLTARKAINQAKHQNAEKRGGGQLLGEADLVAAGLSGADTPGGLERLAGAEPSPEFAAMVAEEYQRLLDTLGDDTLRQIALWKLEGYTNEEIRERLGSALRTVAYKLKLIRKRWESSAAGPGDPE